MGVFTSTSTTSNIMARNDCSKRLAESKQAAHSDFNAKVFKFNQIRLLVKIFLRSWSEKEFPACFTVLGVKARLSLSFFYSRSVSPSDMTLWGFSITYSCTGFPETVCVTRNATVLTMSSHLQDQRFYRPLPASQSLPFFPNYSKNKLTKTNCRTLSSTRRLSSSHFASQTFPKFPWTQVLGCLINPISNLGAWNFGDECR